MKRHLKFSIQDHKKLTLILMVILLVILAFLGLALGSVRIPFTKFFTSFFSDDQYGVIITKLRLPRVIGCILTGTALSVSGLLLQRTTGNELASPNVIGINSGAGFGVMIVLCFIPKATYLLPLFAFLGALLAVGMALGISSLVRTHMTSVTLILSGIAIGSLFSAGISFLSQMYPDVLSSYIVFSAGGFSSVRMNDLYVPGIIIIVCFILSLFLSGRLNLLLLGDDIADSLGAQTKKTKLLSLILTALLTGASVSYAGLLGFVGLMIPHITAKIVGHDARVLLPSSALMGSILVLLADLLGRTVFSPNEISAGIILAFVGAPFFIYLLFRKGVHHAS